MTYTISLACAKGTSQLCERDAQQLGLTDIKTTPTLVRGQGDLTCMYQLCLWSRTASRILVELTQAQVNNVDDIYTVSKWVLWEDTFSPDRTFIVRFSGKGAGVRDTQFGALTVKDAIVDRFRQADLSRPSVDKDAPDVKIDAHLNKGTLTIALDVSDAIHQRGYRTAHGSAPIRENLAAAMVMRTGWTGETALIDPLCGSGTLLIEGAMLAADIAPALNRAQFGFEQWFEHVPKQWQRVLDDAVTRAARGIQSLSVPIVGYESDAKTVAIANENIERAGLSEKIIVEQRELTDFSHQVDWGECGTIVCNPPYGTRLGEVKHIGALYDKLGQGFKAFPEGWRMAVISGLAETPRHLHLRPEKTYSLPNGPIEAKVYLFAREAMPEHTSDSSENSSPEKSAAEQPAIVLTGDVLMFANRLRKNLKSMAKITKNRDIHAYRLYDADIPEYGMAVDVYDDIERGRHLHVQIYDAPKSVAESEANRRNNDAVKALTAVLDVPRHKVFIKKRERQKGTAQYDKQNDSRSKRGHIRVREGQGVFSINLADYLDTGLFLDHRLMRERIAQKTKSKRVLNLFCYTSSVGVHAALGGAVKTTNVDLSQTYLDWSIRNYHLNGIAGIDEKHRFIKADVMAWLEKDLGKYDIIFCDPPTFSNTKKTGRVFDVQSDHIKLISLCMKRLADNGTLYFSNNFRKFKLDDEIGAQLEVKLLTDTIDFDFKRRTKIHRVWTIRKA